MSMSGMQVELALLLKKFSINAKMQAVQPKLKYKSDPQKLNAEMVKLYRDNGVNPLGDACPGQQKYMMYFMSGFFFFDF